MLARAAASRLISDAEAARNRLVDELRRSTGEVLVHDRYFGQHADEWEILKAAPGSVRVLTGKIADEEPQISANVSAKYRPKARMHDRFLIWDGGGIAIGGSPSTFGQAAIEIRRLSAAEVDARRSNFEALWACELFRPL